MPATGAEHGWYGIGLSEDLGGAGGSWQDLAVVVEAAGATCAASAAGWSAGVVGRLFDRRGLREPVEAISEGAVVTIPVGDIRRLAEDVRVEGGALSAEFLALGSGAGLLAVPFLDEGVQSIAVVSGATIFELATGFDRTREYARVSLDAVPVGQWVLSGVSLFDEWEELIALTFAIDAAGAAREALTRTLRYSIARTQFGRPIGSFQAYKHRLSDAFLLLKLSQSLAYRAASIEGESGFASAAFAAAVDGIPNAIKVCGEAVQLHGGMGFTWEAGIHLLLRRCRADEIIAGSSNRAISGLRRSW
jgi:alkylation response protein AidB-like acyl-CoA dehydrogenase